MSEKQDVIDSILTRPTSAVEALHKLLELAEAGRMDLVSVKAETPQELMSGHLPPMFVATGDREVTIKFKLLEEPGK